MLPIIVIVNFPEYIAGAQKEKVPISAYILHLLQNIKLLECQIATDYFGLVLHQFLGTGHIEGSTALLGLKQTYHSLHILYLTLMSTQDY